MKAELRRAIALLSLLCAVASTLFAGTSYFFCPGMQRAAKSCCCPSERSSESKPELARAPCCDRTTLAAAPSAPTDSSRQAGNVPAANALAGERIRIFDGSATDFRDRTDDVRARGARAGPRVELFELHAAYLI